MLNSVGLEGGEFGDFYKMPMTKEWVTVGEYFSERFPVRDEVLTQLQFEEDSIDHMPFEEELKTSKPRTEEETVSR